MIVFVVDGNDGASDCKRSISNFSIDNNGLRLLSLIRFFVVVVSEIVDPAAAAAEAAAVAMDAVSKFDDDDVGILAGDIGELPSLVTSQTQHDGAKKFSLDID